VKNFCGSLASSRE